MLRFLLIFVLAMVSFGLWMSYFDVLTPFTETQETKYQPMLYPFRSAYKITVTKQVALGNRKVVQSTLDECKNLKPEVVEKAEVISENNENVRIYVFTKNAKVFTSVISKPGDKSYKLQSMKVLVNEIGYFKTSYSKGKKVLLTVDVVSMKWQKNNFSKPLALIVAIIVTILLLGLIIWSVIDLIKKLVKRRQDSRKEKPVIIEPAYSFQKNEKRIRPKK